MNQLETTKCNANLIRNRVNSGLVREREKKKQNLGIEEFEEIIKIVKLVCSLCGLHVQF